MMNLSNRNFAISNVNTKNHEKQIINDKFARCNKSITKHTTSSRRQQHKKQRKMKKNLDRYEINHFIEKENPTLWKIEGMVDVKAKMVKKNHPLYLTKKRPERENKEIND